MALGKVNLQAFDNVVMNFWVSKNVGRVLTEELALGLMYRRFVTAGCVNSGRSGCPLSTPSADESVPSVLR